MSPEAPVTRAEMERRLAETMQDILREHREAQQHQDEAWNQWFRAIRLDFKDQLGAELGHFNLLLEAKLEPIRKVSYGSVALLVSVLLIFLAVMVQHKP
jgi:hypothetical protein